FLARFDDERGATRLVLVGVGAPKAVTVAFEIEGERRPRFRRAQPDEAVRPEVGGGLEVLGVALPDDGIRAVGGKYQVRVAKLFGIDHLAFEAKGHAGRAA